MDGKEGVLVPASYRLTDLALPYLLDTDDLSLCAKALYELVCHHQPDSIAQLALAAGLSRETVRRECMVLKDKGWFKLEVVKARRTIIVPTAPDELQKKLAEALTEWRNHWFRVGESLMKALLDNTVASSDYFDNCRPGHIANPKTGHRLEFDRLYYPDVAFEFQGPQHRRRTSLHQSEEEFREAQERDLVKAALAAKFGIQIVEIVETDLTIDGILAKIPNGMPLVRIDKEGKFIHRLNQMGYGFIAYCKRKSQEQM